MKQAILQAAALLVIAAPSRAGAQTAFNRRRFNSRSTRRLPPAFARVTGSRSLPRAETRPKP